MVALLAAVPSAKADELADLRANQELLQQRLDQLAQAGPSTGPSGPIGVGTFPRSFLIPGTDTSLRIGGQGVGSVLWYMKGQAQGSALNGQGGINEIFTDGQGGTGNLASIPLNISTTNAPNFAGTAHSRAASTLITSVSRKSQGARAARSPSRPATKAARAAVPAFADADGDSPDESQFTRF